MFNGIIFNKSKVLKIEKRKNGINLFLKSNLPLKSSDLGISISCDGVCLTLISIKNKILEFYLSNETLVRSKFKKIIEGDIINLELPLKNGQNISGHICQGHVDTVGKVSSIKKVDKSYIYKFKVKKKYIKYLIEKASIIINGVSLTISKVVAVPKSTITRFPPYNLYAPAEFTIRSAPTRTPLSTLVSIGNKHSSLPITKGRQLK